MAASVAVSPTFPALAVLLAEAELLWLRITPDDRSTVAVALVTIIVLFAALLAVGGLARRHARRATARPLPTIRHCEDDWARRPLVPGEPAGDAGDSEAP